MDRPHDVITFDCYGTLVDWRSGIASAFEGAAAAAGRTVERKAVLAAHAEIEPAVEAERYRPYREVLAETARRVAGRFGWPLDVEQAAFLADSLPGWPAFPDTVPALARLAAAGHRLGILSNVDRDLLAATISRLDVPFEFTITAEDLHSYKPAHAHFLAARERIGAARWLHAAQSWFHDVVPATELAIPVAWINRQNEPRPATGPAPREFPDLAALAAALGDPPHVE